MRRNPDHNTSICTQCPVSSSAKTVSQASLALSSSDLYILLKLRASSNQGIIFRKPEMHIEDKMEASQSTAFGVNEGIYKQLSTV
jgi:hypothetical protein